jgi:hypothetical protein
MLSEWEAAVSVVDVVVSLRSTRVWCEAHISKRSFSCDDWNSHARLDAWTPRYDRSPCAGQARSFPGVLTMLVVTVVVAVVVTVVLTVVVNVVVGDVIVHSSNSPDW